MVPPLFIIKRNGGVLPQSPMSVKHYKLGTRNSTNILLSEHIRGTSLLIAAVIT